jgi:tetratricopeptide (TPR) repeat protein
MSKPLNNITAVFIAAVLLSACGVPSTTVKPDSTEKTSPASGTAARKGTPLPASAKAAFDRALWSVKAGRDQEAIDLFRQMSKDNPDIAIVYTNLGLLYLKKGNMEAAQKALEQSISLDPGDALALNHLGVALREQGKFQESQTAYLRAIKLDEYYADAHLNLGILYDLYLQQLPRALQQYQRYQELTGGKDQTVAKWIVDLQRRAGAK